MKELLLQYAAYNTWANQQLMAVMNTLPPEKLTAIIPSSFNSLHQTVLHLLDAESIWWQRLKLQERIDRPSDTFDGNTQEALQALLQQNTQWQQWVQDATERMLEHVFHYKNSKREQFKQPVYQMLLHLFNHGTYHRGQIVNMLRQLGVEKLPATDFIVWSRKNGSK
ncbi:DinB family protein [Chitinophagaceae bacterium LB-8]|uniref:DinB family protein n=1 Tax=Paraflavisolibacter caeni TaxID=2982496 RepID=A0A9X2XVB5_9BACT|nr:DinB family protein [Paraflavisolibacter caeni]MCU7548403.1 DinB family protein [Paraflavisolibacter caeni]